MASAIGPDDVRISPDGMARQAAVAREHGDVQLAENLLRAAELLAAALVAIERAASDVNARPTTIEWKDLM
ncbi:diol dehydratase small subunit [Mycolicibacterium boenickei]